MNKVVKFLLIFLFFTLFLLVVSMIRLHYMNSEKIKLENEIKKLENENNMLTEGNQSTIDEISKLKEEQKEKWDELKIWEKAKSKLEKAKEA